MNLKQLFFLLSINFVLCVQSQLCATTRVGQLSWVNRGTFELERPFKQQYKNWILIELQGAAPFYGKITSSDGKKEENVLLMRGKNKSNLEKYGQRIGKLGTTNIYKKRGN